MILKDKNEGILGYIADLGSSVVLGMFGGKFLGSQFATGSIVGGVVATGYRAYQENNPATPTGAVKASMQGLGNLNFSSDGLGLYVQQDFPYPNTLQWQNGQLVKAPSVGAALPAASAAAVSATLPSDTGRYSRY